MQLYRVEADKLAETPSWCATERKASRQNVRSRGEANARLRRVYDREGSEAGEVPTTRPTFRAAIRRRLRPANPHTLRSSHHHA